MLVKRVSGGEGSERLRDRRRKSRRLGRVLLVLVALMLGGAFVWLTWRPEVRIANVELSRDDASILELVTRELSGTYFGLVPRDSTFFVPERAIRAAVIGASTDIYAVGVEYGGLTSLSVTLHERVPVARWCGIMPSDVSPISCYLFDADGYLYTTGAGASTSPLHTFVVYDELKDNALEPLRATLLHASAMPSLFDFARQVETVGAQVESAALKGDEATLTLLGGTRVVYVLGSEESAFTDLISAGENLDLKSGVLEYVDLRFSGKVYLKRVGETQ